MNDALLPFRRYFTFSGRSRRREFWLYTLLVIVVGAVAMYLDTALNLGGTTTTSSSTTDGIEFSFNATGGILSMVWALFTFIPSLAVSVRRLHDTDRSAWWLLILFVPLVGAIVYLVFVCSDGTPGPNRYGPSPKTDGLAYA